MWLQFVALGSLWGGRGPFGISIPTGIAGVVQGFYFPSLLSGSANRRAL